MPLTINSNRVLAAFEGCYEAERAAALSGVPISTVYYWAREGIVVPTIAPERPKRWSYADLMALRLVYWLRHPKSHDLEIIQASPMNEVRRALEEVDKLGLDLWSPDGDQGSPLRVDPTGDIFIGTADRFQDSKGAGVFEESLDLLGPFSWADGRGPDLISPRPHLRIVPGKVAGETHVAGSRVTTRTLAALYRRFDSIENVAALYPDLSQEAITEAIELEGELAA
ncbi:MAG: DUF433 domain-containing protein [Acidimicrobiia bacterium]|nr:DUF433 domain-containing protein [Acidimicrobiia bacterium]